MKFKDIEIGTIFYLRNKKFPGAYPDRVMSTTKGVVAISHRDIPTGHFIEDIDGEDEVFLMVG